MGAGLTRLPLVVFGAWVCQHCRPAPHWNLPVYHSVCMRSCPDTRDLLHCSLPCLPNGMALGRSCGSLKPRVP